MAHSTIVGGSTAGRLIACPASFRETLLAPAGATSIYAEAGTADHEAMAFWLQNPDADLVGMVFNGRTTTQEDVEARLAPAWDALVDLQEYYGGGFKVVALEARLKFPGVPGAFGTGDAILQSSTHTLLVDFKFGQGVKVFIHTPAGEPNPQLLFYSAGAQRFIGHRQLVIAIIQPTFDPALSHLLIIPKQLQIFRRTLEMAVARALSDAPPKARGEHCRFAPCKTTCALWTGPLLDLTALGKPPPAATASPESDKWGAYLAAAKRLVDSALQYQKQIDSALIEHLRQGGKAPGFALKLSAKNRKWLDDADYVADALERLGLHSDQIWRRSLQTFTVVDGAARRLGVEVPDELRPRPPATDFVLTDQNDPAAVDPAVLTAEFTAALRAIAHKQEV